MATEISVLTTDIRCLGEQVKIRLDIEPGYEDNSRTRPPYARMELSAGAGLLTPEDADLLAAMLREYADLVRRATDAWNRRVRFGR